jgi:hypothetical protein
VSHQTMPTLHAMRPSFQGLMQTRKQNSLISFPKVCIKLLHFIPSQSLVASSSCLLAAVSHHKIQPFPPLPIHTHPYPPSLHKCRAHLSPPLHLLRLCLLSHSLYRSPPPTNPPHYRHTTFLPYPLYPPKTYTLQVSCKAIRRTSGGLTLPSLLTLKV